MAINENIRAARKDSSMTQKDLAKKAGMAEITIRQYEAGKYKPKIETVRRIASALNIPMADLLDGCFAEYGQEIVNDFASSATQFLQGAVEAGEKVLEDSKEAILITSYRRLNPDGKMEAVKRVSELTEIKKYTEIEAPESESDH